MRCLISILLVASLGAAAFAGPQHWGFGFGYLVTLEQDGDGRRALSVYEPPLRVKDTPWLLRWRDASDQYGDVLPGALAVGNFWPEPMGGKEHVLLLRHNKPAGYTVQVLDPPEAFGTRPWRAVSEARRRQVKDQRGERQVEPLLLLAPDTRVIGLTAGDVLKLGRDQLIVLQSDQSTPPNFAVAVYAPPETRHDDVWTLRSVSPVAKLGVAGTPTAIAAADFWGTGEDSLLLVIGDEHVHFTLETAAVHGTLHGQTPKSGMSFAVAKPVLTFTETVPAGDGPAALVACDFLKDGFAYLARASAQDPALAFRTPPWRGERFNTEWVRPLETFAGAKLKQPEACVGQPIMTGTRQNPFGRIVAAGGGRIFGYITAPVDERKEKLWKPWEFEGRKDVEISFVHRTPVYRLGVPKEWQDGDWPWEPDAHFGWPFEGEEVTYQVNLKNNGREPIPAGVVHLQAWVNRPERNADLVSDAPPDVALTISDAIPPFDPADPKYTVIPIPLKWPFDLVQPEGWTWKKLNVRDVGERWLIVRLDYETDMNERNDRYELALNSLLFRPVLRFDVDAPAHPTPEGIDGKPERKINTLAWRAPVVVGDPESKEYYGRKLADAVQCMWERSRTSDGGDVWQRIVFDSYRLYDPQGREGLKPLNRADDWSFYEGPRENEHWLGLWGDYERFDPRDGGAELHETGHLFHRIGDLYHYFIFPAGLREIPLADGTPVQMYTYAWGLDSFCSGHAIIGEATCDLHRYIEGARYGLGWPWHRMLPDKTAVRVLDRDGEPVPDAQIALWLHPENRRHSAGATDARGVWEPGLPQSSELRVASSELGTRDQGSEGSRDQGGEDSAAGDRKGYRPFEPFNIKLWEGRALDSLAQVFTVDLPGYSDFMIWGAEETHAHSRYTLMHESLRNREGWTWDFHTLYKAGAPEPRFDVTAAVQGREIRLVIAGPAAERHRIYRRWEPTYRHELIEDGARFLVSVISHGPAGDMNEVWLDPTRMDQPVEFTDDMGAADWFTEGRYRAAYYVTEMTPAGSSVGALTEGFNESLPKRVYGIAMERVNGVSDLGDGRLMVALNCGKAEPFGVECRGTTPVAEVIRHFRFGHTAAKIVGSRANPQRYYATLVRADLPGAERFFDLIQFDKPDRHNRLYPVLQNTAECRVTEFTTEAPYTVTIDPDQDARAAINAGDWACVGDTRARILNISEPRAQASDNAAPSEPRAQARNNAANALTLTLDKPLFKPDQKDGLHQRIEFGGGAPGDKAEMRELNQPRGLAVFAGAEREGDDPPPEYIAIADTGNGRVVVWDSTTRFVAAWTPEQPDLLPVAVAADPNEAGRFFVLCRNANGPGRVMRLGLRAGKLEFVDQEDWLHASDGADGLEIGLAAAIDPKSKLTLLAVTDSTSKRVVVMPFAPGASKTVSEHTEAIGAFAGEAALSNPTDVAFTVVNGELQLYCADGRNRIVRLR